MRKRNLLFVMMLFLFAGTLKLSAQCFNCGTGADGPMQYTTDTTIQGGTYNFTSFIINQGVTVNVSGNQPLQVLCSVCSINGTLKASGGNGTNGVTFGGAGSGGTGVAGGANGGNGTYGNTGPLNGNNGYGMGAGGQGIAWSGGGGAGYASSAASSGGSGGAGGNMYGNIFLNPPYAGSGGGGGSGGNECGSGGGGAGGGLIIINSCSNITIGNSGAILCNGGNGGSDGTGNCGGGGGGSGGAIWLATSGALTINGSVSAVGGTGGSSTIENAPYYGLGTAGANGRIRFDYNTISANGTVNPPVQYSSTAVQMVIQSLTADTDCYQQATATAIAVVSGGTAPYSYSWTHSASTDSIASNLLAGQYSVVVSDNAGCSVSGTVTVDEYPLLQTVQQISICNGNSITVGAHVYNTSNTYYDTLTSTAGCDSFITTQLTVNNAMDITFLSDTDCFLQATASAIATVSGGVGPYMYAWGGTSATDSVASNLSAGTYQLTVTDNNHCSAIDSVTIHQYSRIVATQQISICSGESFAVGAHTYDTSGTYYDTLTATIGCDSFLTTQLTVKPLPEVSFSWDSMVTSNQLQVFELGDTTWCGYSPSALLFFGGIPAGGIYTGKGISSNTVYTDSLYTLSGYNGKDTITYTVNINGCSASVSDWLSIWPCEGINQLSSEQSISLYPNPVNNTVIVQSVLFSSNNVAPVLYDITGKLIMAGFTRQQDEFVFNTSNLSPGIYFIKLNIAGNEAVKRFVKVE